MEVPVLETRRLLLRPLEASDFGAWAAMYADDEFAAALGYPAGLTEEDAWRTLAFHVGHWSLRGFGMWAVVERRAPQLLIGRIGFFQPEGWPGFEIGWALDRSFWGRGYASEGARAALAHGFDVLRRSRIISLIAPTNARSAGVARRIGESLVDRIELHGRPTDVWAVDRSVWLTTARENT